MCFRYNLDGTKWCKTHRVEAAWVVVVIKQGQLLLVVIVGRCGSLSIVLDLWEPAGPPSELWVSNIGYVFHMHQFHQQVLVTPCLMATLIHILVPVFLCYSIVYNLLNKLQLVPLWKVNFCASEPSYKASAQLWWGKSYAQLEVESRYSFAN